jgi:hypothetical protein
MALHCCITRFASAQTVFGGAFDRISVKTPAIAA